MEEITLKSLSASVFPDEQTCLKDITAQFSWDHETSAHVYAFAHDMVQKMRSNSVQLGMLESFLQRFPLSSDEGLALMCIAEALLRIPDTDTANALVADKIGSAHWAAQSHLKKSDHILQAAGLGLLVGNKAINSPLSHFALPVIRSSIFHAVQKMGHQFVLGEDIDEAFARATPCENRGCRLSYDMLGEAARTQADADHYFQAYKNVIHTIMARQRDKPDTPYKSAGLSVKLSALHPRYEVAQHDLCIPAITERMIALCIMAAKANIALTIDAEESERLTLSLEIIENLLQHRPLAEWNGLGFAVQAYQKRALSVITWAQQKAKTYDRKIHIRLVKGAYWDREIKRAQALGLNDYPVFTRKSHTDINYLTCAQKMLQASPQIFPMFATHNAHTIAAVCHFAKTRGVPFEFQRLHGMGEGIYNGLPDDCEAPLCIYAPVGPYKDLLPYLVRRMLENGANTSFINRLLDPHVAIELLLKDPLIKAQGEAFSPHPKIAAPLDLFEKEKPRERLNSRGLDLDDEETLDFISRWITPFFGDNKHYTGYSLVNGRAQKDGEPYAAYSPSDLQQKIGTVWPARGDVAEKAVRKAHKAFAFWSQKPVQSRSEILLRYADLLEDYAHELFALLVREAGKTLPDAQAEIREAIDFCRYYAGQIAQASPSAGIKLPGVTGESNIYSRCGRGAFICISPWNFPLAIFTGQIAAALVTGNTVVAKPAEQTPLIATFAVHLWHKAGIPKDVLNLVIGDGFVGENLVNHPQVAGVVFTGSVETARHINQSLALKKGPIVPFIAETGGQNAMIVDSSALMEQVVDDVITSAFGSAGQRCSALRILLIQEDAAPTFIRMLQGAMKEMRIDHPQHIHADIGPIIDDEARSNLYRHCANLDGFGKLIARAPLADSLEENGFYFAPRAFEIHDLSGLDKEVFGPILHIIRYKKNTLDDLLEQLNTMGYGLTLGIHSRIDSFVQHITQHVSAGNVYVNRSMIGAVVGSQPFGGYGLSGTGPKAGGPDYLLRFMKERAVTTNTTATGGNVGLVSLLD